MFFDSWTGLARVAIAGVCAFAALVLLLRITGQRTLSKMNAFDFIVTVALGSTLATILLSKDASLVEGGVALALLIFLQISVAWLSLRSEGLQNLIKSTPLLLFHGGKFLEDAAESGARHPRRDPRRRPHARAGGS